MRLGGEWFHRRRIPPGRGGWSLVELLVVLAVIGILAALLLVAVQAVREAARRAHCASQIRQIATAMAGYEAATGCFPPGCSYPGMAMWSAFLLPFIEQNNLAESIDLKGPWGSSAALTQPSNQSALGTWIALLQCPSAGLPRTQWDNIALVDRTPCSYLACASGTNDRESGLKPWCGMHVWQDPNSGVTYPPSDGIFYMNSRTRHTELGDGLSHTMLIGESVPDQDVQGDDFAGHWQKVDHWFIGSPELFDYTYLGETGSSEVSECLGSTAAPINALREGGLSINERELSFGSCHPAGVQIGMADGHVRMISQAMDRAAWSALGTRYSRSPAALD